MRARGARAVYLKVSSLTIMVTCATRLRAYRTPGSYTSTIIGFPHLVITSYAARSPQGLFLVAGRRAGACAVSQRKFKRFQARRHGLVFPSWRPVPGTAQRARPQLAVAASSTRSSDSSRCAARVAARLALSQRWSVVLFSVVHARRTGWASHRRHRHRAGSRR